LQEEDEVSQASQSGGDSQSGGASGDHDIAPQPNRPPLTDEEQAGLDQQELPDLGGHLRQEASPPRDINQEDLEQILTEYSDEETKLMVNTRTRSKPQLDYSVLHRSGRKELVTKATYLSLRLHVQPRNWKEAINLIFEKK